MSVSNNSMTDSVNGESMSAVDMSGADEYIAPLIGAIDQGTSSSRFLIFSAHSGALITMHQIELKQKCPQEGWVEMDPHEMLDCTKKCIDLAVEKLKGLGFDPSKIKAIGVTNQRETTIVWDKTTGQALSPAIVWLDQRTASLSKILISQAPGKSKDAFRSLCGLPIHPYFSALKLRWILDEIPIARQALNHNKLMAGTVDTWLIWNLTRSPGQTDGAFVTDVTNASRTMLMNIKTLKWDTQLCTFFGIPMNILPEIRSSAEIYGTIGSGLLAGVAISGCLGDQQAALVGQGCLKPGSAKNTYGTGCFMLFNVGDSVVQSHSGLLSTVAYQLGPERPVCYALEGSVAIAGVLIRWLRDNMELLKNSADCEDVASSVQSCHGVYFVPAFSGLYAPHWQPDARGTVCGLTQYTTKGHFVRAALEAVCFQTCEIVESMNVDCGQEMTSLKVDGGMTKNDLLMQLQSDLLGVTVIRPQLSESTAFGAAAAAAMAPGIDLWSPADLENITPPCDSFEPRVSFYDRTARLAKWKCAVKRSLGWACDPSEDPLVEASKESTSILGLLALFGGGSTIFGLGALSTFLVLKYYKFN